MSMKQGKLDGFDDAGLEALFAEARATPADPVAADFARRLCEQADAVQSGRVTGGWLARLRAALADIGGAPGLAGVGVAGLAGMWIGFSGPGPTGDLVTRFWQAAASVSAPVSALIDADPLSGTGDDLLSLMHTSE